MRRDFRTIDPADAVILIVECEDRLLPPYPPTISTNNTQPRAGERLLFMIARMVLSEIAMVPPLPMISNSTPCRPRNVARVTTNEGMPSRATRVPTPNPMTMPVPIAATTAIGHAIPCSVISTPMMAAVVPAV